jgi:hypothetical protein
MGGQHRRKLAVGLGAAAGILLVAAWLADPPAGPVMAAAGLLMGLLIARTVAAAPKASVPEAVVPKAVVSQGVVSQAPLPPQPEPTVEQDPATEGAAITALRHDLRGILSPAMLIADRLATHADPSVQRAGDVITRTVERAAARLAETKKTDTQNIGGELPPPPA